MNTKAEFNLLYDRYRIAYKKCNGHFPKELSFLKGWVYLNGSGLYRTKIRLGKLKVMCETLEKRNERKSN